MDKKYDEENELAGIQVIQTHILFSYFAVANGNVVIFLVFLCSIYQTTKKDIYQRAQDSIERIENWMNTQFQEMSRIVLEINNDGIFSYAPISSKSQREELIAELLRYVRGYSFAMDMSYESMLDENTIYSSQGIFERENFEKYIYDIAEDFDEEVYLMRRNTKYLRRFLQIS